MKPADEKEPIIAKILTVLGMACFGAAALCVVGAALSVDFRLVIVAVAIGTSGVLYIALSEIVIYLSTMTLLLRKLTQNPVDTGEKLQPMPAK